MAKRAKSRGERMSTRVSMSTVYCDYADVATGHIHCSDDAPEGFTAVYGTWEDRDSLLLTGASVFAAGVNEDLDSYCDYDGTGDDLAYGIECFVPCDGVCLYAHHLITVMTGSI